MTCKTEGCTRPVVRKSNRGRPPRYCDACKTGYAADIRSKSGTSHKPPAQPHMLAEEIQAELAEKLERELDELPPEDLGSQHYEHLMGATADTFEFISFDRLGGQIRIGHTTTRVALRKPVMDLENEPHRGPATIGTDDLMPGATDDYYEQKRRQGLITDERHTN